jgi:hypothetical protein
MSRQLLNGFLEIALAAYLVLHTRGRKRKACLSNVSPGAVQKRGMSD